jgi:peptidylprolyl isomerase
MGLFGEDVPITVANFIALCSGTHKDKKTNKTLTFKNTTFHRIIPNFMVQGGDITHGNGVGSISVYGEKFNDENFLYKHEEPGVISMANSGKIFIYTRALGLPIARLHLYGRS